MPEFATLRSVRWTAAALCVLAFGQVAAKHCGVQPRSLPITNYTLGDGVALNRGIFVQIGGEALSLRISTGFSNTRLRNRRDCQQGNATAESGCVGASGSIFDLDKSNTWQRAAAGAWNVSVVDPREPGETILEGWDVAQFGAGPSIPSFPLEVWSNQASENKSGLAFGPESSFLDWFLLAKQVPSKVFGIFFGSRSQLQGIDGNVTIGGYDRARVNGPWTNFSMEARYLNSPCPLQVLIKDIRLNIVNGSFSLFQDPGTTLGMCIDPLQNGFTLTNSMYDVVANVTRQSGVITSAGQPTYLSSLDGYLGNLSITLANGYETLIPHYELVSQVRGTDSEGKYSVVDPTRLTMALNYNQNTTVPTLGGVFLSQNYLLVDYENQMFGLAPAVVGNLGNQAHDIVTVCNATTSSADTPKDAKKNTSAIVGGVIGGVIGVVILGGFLLYIIRTKKTARQKKPKAAQPSLANEQGSLISSHPPRFVSAETYEVDASHGVSEVPGEREVAELQANKGLMV